MTSAAVIAQSVQKNLVSSINVPKTMEIILKLSDFNVTDFEIWGEELYRNNDYLQAIQLAPDGIIKYCYPIEGNEMVIGNNLLKDKTRYEGAMKAIESRELTVVGPFRLKQGNKWGIVARLPLFIEKDGKEVFWGFAISVILMKDILPENLNELVSDGMSIMFRGDDPDNNSDAQFYMTEGFDRKNELVVDIKTPNGLWQIALNHPEIRNRFYLLLRIVLIIIGLMICGYIIIHRIKSVRQRDKIVNLNSQLKELSIKDPLTGVGNRRYGEQEIDNLIKISKRYNETFSIAMFDLDYFKQINDTYGHNDGDLFLKHFTKLLSRLIRESDLFIRIGGDEFIIIFPETGITDLKSFVEKIYLSFKKNPCTLSGAVQNISVSIGIVEYSPGENMDQLLERADIQLYRSKENGRNIASFG